MFIDLLKTNGFILAGTLCYFGQVGFYLKTYSFPQASMMFLYGLANLCIIWSTFK